MYRNNVSMHIPGHGVIDSGIFQNFVFVNFWLYSFLTINDICRKHKETMGLVWVGNRGTCPPPHVFGGGGLKALCPPHVSQGKIFSIQCQDVNKK